MVDVRREEEGSFQVNPKPPKEVVEKMTVLSLYMALPAPTKEASNRALSALYGAGLLAHLDKGEVETAKAEALRLRDAGEEGEEEMVGMLMSLGFPGEFTWR